MPAHSGVHYPHSTIESAGHSLSGHANTLHSSASSASGIHLPGNALGSIGSSHASTAQSHIGGVAGHINTIAEREGHHGNTLVANSTNMRNTDEEHAANLNGIHSQRTPLMITNGPGPAVGAGPHTTHVDYGALPRPGDRPLPTPEQLARMHDLHNRPTQDYSYPSVPRPGAIGPNLMSSQVPGETHAHTSHGDFKPAQPPGPGIPNAWHRPQTVGGHVASGDITGPPPAHTLPPPPAGPAGPRPIVHGQGVDVTSGVDASGRPINVGNHRPNGVYEVTNGPLAGPGASVGPGAPQAGNNPNVTQGNKPFSTMFPQGMTDQQVHEMGTQAWNGGTPNGGTHHLNNPNNPNGGASTW
ncbi:MAG TPA: hypothetical protein VHF06_03785, partial [Pseudonocardiaceae bacterium]|nr:hypothetical protein [Pseudonocardiaceae bacterium]